MKVVGQGTKVKVHDLENHVANDRFCVCGRKCKNPHPEHYNDIPANEISLSSTVAEVFSELYEETKKHSNHVDTPGPLDL